MYVIDEESHTYHQMVDFKETKCKHILIAGLLAADSLVSGRHLVCEVIDGYQRCEYCFSCEDKTDRALPDTFTQ